jgi:outer membrane biosynthesis protein TonB
MSSVHAINPNELQGLDDFLSSSAQDKSFNKILAILLLGYLIVAVVVPFIEQVKIPREIKERPPAQLAKIMLKEKQLPLPKKELIKPKKKKPIKKVKTKDKKKAKPKEKLKQPTAVNKSELAKTKAHSSGLATMKDELFAMREAFTVTPAANTKLNNSKSEATTVKRKLLAAATNKQSSQLTQAQLSKTVASDAISTKNTQQIRLGKEEILADNNVLVANDNDSKSSLAQRSEMDLRRTLESHKARLYALYNRALRKDPLLKGKVLFVIEIQPNGNISHVSIKSSALNNAKLERQLIVILRRIKFPVADVSVMTTIWAIDFLPS